MAGFSFFPGKLNIGHSKFSCPVALQTGISPPGKSPFQSIMIASSAKKVVCSKSESHCPIFNSIYYRYDAGLEKSFATGRRDRYCVLRVSLG